MSMSKSRHDAHYKEEAIPLITYDPSSKKYITNDEAVEFIQGISGPIGVIAVAGMYRTGKSYLLNRMLLNRSSGFGVGPTVNPCTKGLWVWGKPILGQTVDGESISILIIDSEGIGALDEDSTHDSRIFALSILLSSCFIYNSVGSIDENAIQNLSLVVNITKNIQIKSQTTLEDIDSEEYSNYFPSFFWVVRDFTLQLVDQEGEQISPKEYLERALGAQKGFSESVEAKNRIRRLLQTFFKERDCCTLVRPLTNEENLQNLDKLDFDKLRPEFFEQVITLRKKILNRMKPKRLNNKNLNGEMYSVLIKSYVNAINQGAVPNIESAWTYICRNECAKAAQDALDAYEKNLKEALHGKIPTTLEELKIYHKLSKDSAFAVYRKKAVGDVTDEFFKEFIKRIKMKFSSVKSENEKESIRVCSNFINHEFSTIEAKLKTGEYKYFAEYERDIRLFYSYFMENGPRTANKQIIILDYLQKALKEGASYFLSSLTQEIEIQKTISGELNKKLEREVKESKEDMMREKNSLIQKLSKLEAEKAELEIKEQTMRDTVASLKNDREKDERQYKNELLKERAEAQRQNQDLKNRAVTFEERLREVERQSLLKESENDKEKALLTQKINYLEKSLDEVSKSSREQSNELKNTRKDYSGQMREISVKYETMTKGLQSKITELQEKILELENDLGTKEQKFEMDRKKWSLNEKNLNATLTEANETILALQREVRELKVLEERHNDYMKLESEKTIQNYQERVQKLEELNRQKDESLKLIKGDSEKEKALLIQKLEFLDVQLSESRQQLLENKKAHEQIIRAIEANERDAQANKLDNKQLLELRESHRREIKNLETEFDSVRKRLTSQIEQLTEKNNELEFKAKFEANDLSKEISNLREQLEMSEAARSKLADQNKNLDSQKLRLLKDSEERYVAKIKQLESQLEEQTVKSNREIREIQQKSEEQLAQLKNFYEIEKDRLEKRIAEEKGRYESRIQHMHEEFEEKMKEEQNTLEEELENVKDELREQEAQNQSLAQQFEHEMALKQQTIDNLEKYAREARESIQNLQQTNNNNYEQQQSIFSNERKALIAKIDALTSEMNLRERDLISVSQKKENLEVSLTKREATADALTKEFQEEKIQLNQRIEEARQKFQQLNDEYLEKKIEYGRELALTQQQNEFLIKKIDDLQKQIDSLVERYEEKLKLQKEELSQETSERLERIREDKGSLEQKYEKTKRQLKEIEGTFNKQLSALERDKALLLEKQSTLESQKAENEVRLQNEIASLQSQVVQLKDVSNSDKKVSSTEIEKYRSLYNRLEQEKTELTSNYEKDKALWEGKYQFLEQQKNQAKQDLSEATTKFEQTLQHLKKSKNNENQDININELISSLEKKYTVQIQEQQEGHNKTVEDYQEKVKRLEKELRNMNDKLLIDEHGKIGSKILNEKKIVEFMENEKKLNQDIENLKAERDEKILEYQKLLDSEREALKAKIAEIETKFKDSESKRNILLFEHEKERAKWNLEKDHLVNQKVECHEQLDKLEKKKEILMRENEKLKSENRANRKNNSTFVGNSGVSNTFFLSGTGKNVSQKVVHASPLNNSAISQGKKSSISIDKNLSDITNYNTGFNFNSALSMTIEEDSVDKTLKF